MIVDGHVHVFDSSVPGAELNFPLWPGTRWGGSGPDLIRQMDGAGIDKAFLISYSPIDVMAGFPPETRELMTRTFQHYLGLHYFESTWRQNRDRLFWFADSIDPRIPGYVDRAKLSLDSGASGLKLLPLFVDTNIGDPSWRPIFELLGDYGRPCVIDLSWWYLDRPNFAPTVHGRYSTYEAYAAEMAEIATEFSDVNIQIAHYGTPRLIDNEDPTRAMHYDRLEGPIELIRSSANLYCELGAYSQLIEPGEAFPYWRALKVVKILTEALGANRLIWGTDWPYLGRAEVGHRDLVRAIREAPFLNANDSGMILGGNAIRILGAREHRS